MENSEQSRPKQLGQTEYDQPLEEGKNVIGWVGALISVSVIFLAWVPILNWCLLVIGFVLSALSLLKEPRNPGFAGIMASFFGLLFIITYFTKVHGGVLALSWTW